MTPPKGIILKPEYLSLGFLKQRQCLPLEAKVLLSLSRIREFDRHFDGQEYIAFSGGTGSTVLVDLVRQVAPDVPAVHYPTGLEFPEIDAFVNTITNVVRVKPKMPFHEVIKKYGVAVGSKKVAHMLRALQNPTDKNENTRKLYMTGESMDGRVKSRFRLPEKWRKFIGSDIKVSDQCCDALKKEPMRRYQRESKRAAFVGTMASESALRQEDYLRTGCNWFEGERSTPMAFWTQSDVLEYLLTRKLPFASVYGEIIKLQDGTYTTTEEKRTGCMFCMFGVHLEKGENRFTKGPQP